MARRDGRRKSKVVKRIREVFRKFSNRLHGYDATKADPGKHIQVKSSNIRSVAYDPKKKVLEVKFRKRKTGKNESTYRYTGVESKFYKQLLAISQKRKRTGKKSYSVGQHFNKVIRSQPKKYRYERIT